MSRLKQNEFPVYFITQDNTTFWTPYLDMRTRHVETAVAFAKAQSLDGVHSFANELLNSPEKIDSVLEAGLVLSVWGSVNENLETRQWLHERGVHCIQVDGIFTVASQSHPS
ncbi:glycerophosphocholine phosphodiesterase GPCPD1-like [Exaiptasia diaphana]|uniref:GP-PDE domain-containing protein n=1 Tax=Exaiptasia diaphana TaxID=2652724 RepID=A0A913Y3A1_EXADI|nr:glycerophosphocholine phosphodiesterase GPCPD1-like [Exaiptasia diaphana]